MRNLVALFTWLGVGLAAAPAQIRQDPEPAPPMRVLLFADAATREYQFVREYFLRQEMRDFLARDPKKVQLSIYLQSAGTDTDQGVDPEYMLKAFPFLDATPPKRSAFDLIIAFDPDWSAVPLKHRQILNKWVKEQGGGLIVVGGPVNSYLLARPGGHDISSLTGLLPVKLKDNRLHGLGVVGPGVGQQGTVPYRLKFGAGVAELLRLDPSETSAIACWEKFFSYGPAPKGAGKPPARGFFSYAPIDRVDADANILASLVDHEKKEQPFLVTAARGRGKVVFLASGEFWRLRAYKQEYHEKLWWNLAGYAAGKAGASVIASSWIGLPTKATKGDKVTVEFRLVDDKGKPVDSGSAPALRVTPPPGSVHKEFTVTLKPRPGAGLFEASLALADAGEYTLSLEVPGAKEPVSATLRADRLKSLFEAQITDGALIQRQADLRRRGVDWSLALVALAVKLNATRDKAFEKEASAFRDAFDATVNDGWVTRHNALQEDIRKLSARKLVDVTAALEASQAMTDKLQAMRVRLFGAELAKKPADLRKLLAKVGAEEHHQQRSFDEWPRVAGDVERDLRIHNQREDLKPEQIFAVAKAHDEMVARLEASQAQIKEATARRRKALGELQAAGIRPETMLFLQSSCAAQDRQVDARFGAAIKAIRAVQAMHLKKEFDQNLVDKARAEVSQEMDAGPLPAAIGALLGELLELESAQQQQTQILQALHKQIEEELLRQLLEGK